MPLVLVAILVLALMAGEMGLRIIREARVAQIQERGLQAYYVAESGFNRVRASIMNGSKKVDGTPICSSGPSPKTISANVTDSDGNVIGTYSVDVTCGPSDYYLSSTGVAGVGQASGRRVIAGTIVPTGGTKVVNGVTITLTKTTYQQ